MPVDPQDVRIRRAGPADLDEVVRLGLETIRYDAHFGTVIERPGTAGALRHEAAGAGRRRSPWVWLAERDGAPVGLLYAERPEARGLDRPDGGPAPVGLPGADGRAARRARPRGRAALIGQLHRAADESGVAVTLLHYEQVNPLSGPFWTSRATGRCGPPGRPDRPAPSVNEDQAVLPV